MANSTTSPDHIRTMFSRAMSDMYRQEVPQYGTLMELVADVNAQTLDRKPGLKASLERAGELERLDIERHGAIRLGTAEELFTIRRVFAVMGMYPVGYYDLSVAGVPVHSTASARSKTAPCVRIPFGFLRRCCASTSSRIRSCATRPRPFWLAVRIFTARTIELIEEFERAGSTAAGGRIRSRGAGDIPLA